MRACPFCSAAIAHQIVADYPAAMVARAKQLGITPEQHAAQNLSHVSFAVVLFVPHNGPCARPCAGSYTPEERLHFKCCDAHDGIRCPCNADCSPCKEVTNASSSI